MTTDNHRYHTPDRGTEDWDSPLNENFEQFDADIELRDTEGNRGNYTPKQCAKFLATDTGVVYVGDGSEWQPTFALPRIAGGGAVHNLVSGHPTNGIGGGNVDGATVGGGFMNQADAKYATTAGGAENEASGTNAKYAAIGGGWRNVASFVLATIAGGQDNTASGEWSAVGGGLGNTASGSNATVPGGDENTAGGNFSFAAGRNAEAEEDGSFVWGDSSDRTVRSTADDEFRVQAGGGAIVFSASDLSAGVRLLPGAGSWVSSSSRAGKEAIEPVDPGAVLDRVRDLDIATWRYRSQTDGVRHMGPMAEEFHTAFGLGADDDGIATIDADGVALAAIQGLAAKVDDQADTIDERNRELTAVRDELEVQRTETATLRDELAELRGLVTEVKADAGSQPADTPAD